MGKRIVLSESQFKEYVKSQLNENMYDSDNIGSVCKKYSERLRYLSEEVLALGDAYKEFYALAVETLQKLGFGVSNVHECKLYGRYGVSMNLDASNLKDDEGYGYADDEIESEVTYSLDFVCKEDRFRSFFSDYDVKYSNGVLTILPEQSDWVSLYEIYSFLNNSDYED